MKLQHCVIPYTFPVTESFKSIYTSFFNSFLSSTLKLAVVNTGDKLKASKLLVFMKLMCKEKMGLGLSCRTT